MTDTLIGLTREQRREERVRLIKKVIMFLKANPLSTAQEIYAGCGVGVSIAQSWVHGPLKYNGKICYRVNWKKLRSKFGGQFL